MAQQKGSAKQQDTAKHKAHNKDAPTGTPKRESSSEYEGAANRKPTGNRPTEVKTETSSSSGE